MFILSVSARHTTCARVFVVATTIVLGKLLVALVEVEVLVLVVSELLMEVLVLVDVLLVLVLDVLLVELDVMVDVTVVLVKLVKVVDVIRMHGQIRFSFSGA